MKKILAMLLALVMVLSLAACGSKTSTDTTTDAAKKVKIGIVLVGDETEGYTKAHIDGIKSAAKELGIGEDQIIWKYKVKEDDSAYTAADELAVKGCQLVIANSYGHQDYIEKAAKAHPDVTFVSATGDKAAKSGLSNLKNAFTDVYQSRYVSGVVAGMKLKELVDSGKLTKETQPKSFDANGNIKIGYVGAYNYAEVVSGYTAFFLGIKSVYKNVVMEVNYTNSWFDIEKESASAEALVANGCVIIGQHADSTGAPSSVEKLLNAGTICYSVGYNVDMLDVAPHAALTSATNNWAVYYKYAFQNLINGTSIETNWAEGYETGAVAITALGSSCAQGTQEKVTEVESAIKAGTLQVFDTSTFTVGGKTLTTYTTAFGMEGQECIKDGAFTESTLRSAPYFDLRIDGITEDK